jgi:catalase
MASRDPASGGETHQTTGDGAPRLTTQQGIPVADDQNTLRAGQRGPAALEDFHFREKITHFDQERIPERVVHARGYGAHGYFENYEPLTDITRADPLSEAGLRTPVFVRFSTVAGNKGSPDLARDVRGFATKFYTREGNWDLVGNNIPVFFIQDALKFPDVVYAAKQQPDRGFPQAQTAHDNFWDFASLMPEITHMLMWIMSDRAIPRSFRFMEGFGVHTFRLVNAEGRATFVKFHWKPKQGLQSVVWNEALKINGADPDFHRRDLWDAIQQGNFPEWELGLQLFDDEFADRFPFDVLDATKIVPEEDVPIRRVGRLVLDRLPDNFFADTEQVAFCTANVVPGIDFTNDPLLQGRNFSYLDTQLNRFSSTNFTQLPINAPKCPVAVFQQDGFMATRNPRSETFADHHSQARQFFISQTGPEQRHIIDAFVFELSKCDRPDIRSRIVAQLRNIGDEFAQGVADGLGLTSLPDPAPVAREPIRDLPPSPALSILRNGPDSFAGRKIGILAADGIDAGALTTLKNEADSRGVAVELIAPKVGGIETSDGGDRVPADQKIDGAPSVLYDAVVILATKSGAAELASLPAARDFVSDAYAHGKFIGYTAGALPLFEASGVASHLDEGFVRLDERSPADFLRQCGQLRLWFRQLAGV